jgi:ABC-type polysaccharide/polyol phosphate transport system ATPase subunit
VEAVVVEGVSKHFSVPQERAHTLKERVLHPLRRTRHERFQALEDVSFSVEQGEFFGIVGRNGSGKSTLLKCLAGIYRTDGGRILIDGRVSTFIELGVGFNPDLAAEDNIVLNGVMLGLSPKEARRRADGIIDFAGLNEFVDLKLKNYSSGMMVRLAFSVMVQVDADVLLIDEVLAVGDAAFQQKCYDEFNRIRDQGRTVLLVTHQMSAVERFCDRAMLLEKGKITALGDPARVANAYLQVNFEQEDMSRPEAERRSSEPDRFGDQRAEIAEAWFEDGNGRRTDSLQSGEPCAVAMRVRFNEAIDEPLLGFVLEDSQRRTAFASSTRDVQHPTGSFGAGDEIVFRVRFDNIFSPDRYHATPAIAREAGEAVAWIDRRERFASVVVIGTRETDAVVDIRYEVEVSREGVRT